MKFQLVNYFEPQPFGKPLPGDRPEVHCKFVCVQIEDETNLILGPLGDFGYHADLVERFANDNEIPSQRDGQNHKVELFESGHRVLGGGWIKANPVTRAMDFSGASSVYGSCDPELVCDVLRSEGHFSEFAVTVGGKPL